jgi:hypothetical protein
MYSIIGIRPNITLIRADKWSIDGQTIDIRFDLSPILKNDGVYNIITFRLHTKQQLSIAGNSTSARANITMTANSSKFPFGPI